MHKMLLIIALVGSPTFFGCGSEDPENCLGEACVPEKVNNVQQYACRPDTCPPTGGGDDPPPSTKTLTVRLRNTSATTRQCSDVVVAKTNSSGVLVTTTVAPGGIVDAGGEIVGSITFPTGTSVSANGGCWRYGYPTYDYVNGSFPINLTTNKDCTLIYYAEGEYASERMECTSY